MYESGIAQVSDRGAEFRRVRFSWKSGTGCHGIRQFHGELTEANFVKCRYYLGVASLEHVKRCVALGCVEFVAGSRSSVNRLDPGDWVAWYAPRDQRGTGAIIQKFVAIGQVVEGEVRSVQRDGLERYSRPVKYRKAARPAGVHALLEDLTFVKDPRHWGISFRATHRELSMEDFQLLAQVMGVSRI